MAGFGAIDNFISNMSQSGGYARSAQYELVINLPAGIKVAPQERSRQLTLNCETLTWPGHDLQTQSRKYGNEPEQYLVQSHGFEGTITATFYLSEDHTERLLLEQWQELAVNRLTHKANYYSDYVMPAEIYQLGSAAATRKFYSRTAEGPRNEEIRETLTGQEKTHIAVRTYGITMQDVYPSTIALTELSYGLPNEIQRLTVTFQYRQHLPIHIHNGNRTPLT